MDAVTQAEFNELLTTEKKLLVDFYSDFCNPCKTMAKILESIETDCKMVKVNIEHENALAEEYNIQSLPTVIIFDNGEISSQFTGVKPKATIETLISN